MEDVGIPKLINVIVAENGKEPKAYSITIKRRLPEQSNDLTGLVISGSPTGFAFSPTTYAYPNVTVVSNIYTITMRPTAAAGVITVDGANVASGAESNQLLLPDIGNPRTIYVAVTDFITLQTEERGKIDIDLYQRIPPV